MNEIVSADWLNQNLKKEGLIILDSTIQSINEKPDLETSRFSIPEARFFDLKGAFSNSSSPFPNTVPTQEQFGLACRKLGINKTSKIVVFDNLGVYSSPRVWWLFKLMGHDNIAVLDGGLPEWIDRGYLTEKKRNSNDQIGNFEATINNRFVKKYQDIVANLSLKKFQIIDARSEGRYKGLEPEPRKNIRSGHISDSINIPYQEVLENGKFKSKSELKMLFESKAIEDKELVFSCGSGLTACIVLLAVEKVFKNGYSVYDGSWTEWAERQNLKVQE